MAASFGATGRRRNETRFSHDTNGNGMQEDRTSEGRQAKLQELQRRAFRAYNRSTRAGAMRLTLAFNRACKPSVPSYLLICWRIIALLLPLSALM